MVAVRWWCLIDSRRQLLEATADTSRGERSSNKAINLLAAASGGILFIFCRSPFTMHDLNRELLSAGIEIVAAQHLEGGPEAQLYLKTGSEEIDHFGSFETGFREDDTNEKAWPVPNVLGIRLRK